MISLSEAQTYVHGLATELPAVELPLMQACGAVLAAEVVSNVSVPAFDNSAMDGFAVRCCDDGQAGLRVVGTQFAGIDQGFRVGPGEAVRIMTGAPIPAGADAVVPVEVTQFVEDSAGGTGTVRHAESPTSGHFIRRVGEDVRPGDVVLPAGSVLSPAAVGAVASLGITAIPCVRPPRVGVFSTGDELVTDAATLRPGQIRDSNRPTLLAAVGRLGYEAVDLGCIPDDERLIIDALENGVERCDVLLTSGGVSMGEADLIKRVLSRSVDMRWMQVAIRPAKPLAAGLLRGVPIIGLPGNPVSALVSFELFARGVIERRAGLEAESRGWFRAVLPGGLERRSDGKIHFPRVVVTFGDAGPVAVAASAQGSHQLAATASANAIAWLSDGDGIEPGGEVSVLLLT